MRDALLVAWCRRNVEWLDGVRIKLAASGPVEKGTWAAAADGVELEPHVDGGAGDGGAGAGESCEGAGNEGGVSGEEREARRVVTAKLVSLVHRWARRDALHKRWVSRTAGALAAASRHSMGMECLTRSGIARRGIAPG
jgi:hypothetical protein